MFATASTNPAAILQSQTRQNTPMVQVQSAAVLASDQGSNALPASTESYVRSYYVNTPILAEISKCESRFRQFTKNGDILRGRVDKDDIGVMQINERYNGDLAKKLGYDIYTLDGNLAMGQWLYDHQGSAPWSASQVCWDNS